MIMPRDRQLVRIREPRRLDVSATRGLSAPEVIVMVVLFVFAVFVILMVLPRSREHARMAGCQRNLAHIGFALAQFDQLEHHLPVPDQITAPETEPRNGPKSPLRILLEALEQPDLLGLTDPTTRPKPRPGDVPGEMPVPGFVCASDPGATAGVFVAPISYRACTGDAAAAANGAFAPGQTLSLKQVQERDGQAYTSAFSERLVGDNLAKHPAPTNYTLSPSPLPSGACPLPPDLSSWRGDAGSSWVAADYRSTLYNHALPPDGQPSCIGTAGKAAFMGASSGHVGGVNVLFLDGHVSVVRPSIDQAIWKEFARIGPLEPDLPDD